MSATTEAYIEVSGTNDGSGQNKKLETRQLTDGNSDTVHREGVFIGSSDTANAATVNSDGELLVKSNGFLADPTDNTVRVKVGSPNNSSYNHLYVTDPQIAELTETLQALLEEQRLTNFLLKGLLQ